MGAGILPVALYKNEVYFLFGKERTRPDESAPGWSDFGGGHEISESPLVTAAREGAEEMSGFLGNTNKIAKLLKKRIVKCQTKDKKYTSYVVPVPYDTSLPQYFNNQIGFLNNYVKKSNLHGTTMYEKQELKWFSVNMIKHHRKKFRYFFGEVLDELLLQLSEIKQKLKRRSIMTRKRRQSTKKSTKKSTKQLTKIQTRKGLTKKIEKK